MDRTNFYLLRLNGVIYLSCESCGTKEKAGNSNYNRCVGCGKKVNKIINGRV